MGRIITTVAILACACIASADSLDEVSFFRIKDFGGENGRIAMYWRDAMFKRRVGVYCTALRPDEVPFFRAKGLCKLYVGVVSPSRVSMYFEDSGGQMLSCAELMNGKLTDECFYWGPPEDGVVAWYGIVDETMTLAVSPHGAVSNFVLKRTAHEFDERPIRIVRAGDEAGFAGIPSQDRRRGTIIGKVCGGQCCAKAVDDGLATHRCKHGAGEKTAACYVFSFGGRHVKGLSDWDGGGWTELYALLRYDGRLVCVLGKDGETFSMWGPPDHSWTEWFSGNRPNVAWQVSHDAIVGNWVFFGPSGSIDNYLRYPEDYVDKWGIREKLKAGIDRDVAAYASGKDPKFEQIIFVRLDASDSNGKLVQRLESVKWTPPACWGAK